MSPVMFHPFDEICDRLESKWAGYDLDENTKVGIIEDAEDLFAKHGDISLAVESAFSRYLRFIGGEK